MVRVDVAVEVDQLEIDRDLAGAGQGEVLVVDGGVLPVVATGGAHLLERLVVVDRDGVADDDRLPDDQLGHLADGQPTIGRGQTINVLIRPADFADGRRQVGHDTEKQPATTDDRIHLLGHDDILSHVSSSLIPNICRNPGCAIG